MKYQLTVLVLMIGFIMPHQMAHAAPLPDTDHDGLTDAWETVLGTDQTRADSDGDGYPDGTEVLHGYDPMSALATRKP